MGLDCSASWTDDFLEATGAVPLAAGDNGQNYEARWTWVSQSTGLPTPEEHQDLRLFRVRLGFLRTTPGALVNFPIGVDAWEAIDHLVVLWPDLAYRRQLIPWKAKRVHHSIQWGLALEPGVPAYIIVTNDEVDVGPFRDVLIEVQTHRQTQVEVDANAWRITSSITFPSLLAQLALSASCTITHECTGMRNSRTIPTDRGIRLEDADFTLIQLLERPPAQLRSSTANPNLDEGQEEEIDSQVSASPETPASDYGGPVTYVIHRPRFRDTDSRACWIASDTRSNMMSRFIEQHWLDLVNQD